MNCPECNDVLRAGAKSCKCGWGDSGSRKATKKVDKPLQREPCDVCGATLPYYRMKEYKPPGNRIVGRSKKGGYLCLECYGQGETFDWRDKAAQDFDERHKRDYWGSLVSAARSLKGSPKADFVEFMQALKQQARGVAGTMRLPYDPRVNQEAGTLAETQRIIPPEYAK